ncbi:hypothetical protein FACS1894164_16730 [Spirochaetia bacterium]|nr:hypothetical protein FACS1894164_16730 [Spirochaetia bacterium]
MAAALLVPERLWSLRAELLWWFRLQVELLWWFRLQVGALW